MTLNNFLNSKGTLAAVSLVGLLSSGCVEGRVAYESRTYTQEGRITGVYATQKEVKAIDQLSEGDKGALGFVAGLAGPVGLIILGAASDVKTKVPEFHMVAETDSLKCDNVIPLDRPVPIGTPVNVRFEERWKVTYEGGNNETSRRLYTRQCTITDNLKEN